MPFMGNINLMVALVLSLYTGWPLLEYEQSRNKGIDFYRFSVILVKL